MTRHRTDLHLLVALLLALAVASRARAESYDERSGAQKAGLTTAAVAMNVLPVASTIAAPKCLPGYFFCKLAFAGISVVAAAEQVFWSGGKDDGEPQSILYRGFAGDWFVSGRNVAGDTRVEPLPEPPASPGF